MRRIISMILVFVMLVVPGIPTVSYAVTGHVNGCTQNLPDMSCCTKTYNITAKPGYEVVDVIVNGDHKGPITQWTFTDLTGPQEMKVVTRKTASAEFPEFTYSAGEEGYQIIDDGIVNDIQNWRIKFLKSGILRFNSITDSIDVFCVGGGGGGSTGGGAGGYTETQKGIVVSTGTDYTITIGEGGAGTDGSAASKGSDGGVTSAFNVSADGGKGCSDIFGADGGSGGGAGSSDYPNAYAGGAGGSNGSSGSDNTQITGGNGQEKTTREFGESTGTLYAGGGGGGGRSLSGGAGGDGGGGAGGGAGRSAQAGDENTGGGGGGSYYHSGAAGGSGIVVIRNARSPQNTTNTYTITYDDNGGSGAPASQTKTQGVDLTLTSDVPTRNGYTFLGWSVERASEYPVYTSTNNICTIDSNLTLYAVWSEEINTATYTVSYNTNGGGSAPASQTKTQGESITLSNVTPTKTNCLFLGWAKSSTATTAQYAAGATYTDEGDVTLYAVWENLASQMPDFVYTKTDNSFAGTGYETITQSEVGGVKNWQIKVKADGQITFNKVVDKVDIFLVGGGGGSSVGSGGAGPGGGGGYTTTIRGVEVQEGVTYIFDVGAGGLGNVTGTTGNGKPSKVLKLVNSNQVQIGIADGGYSGANGGDGGSGGGGNNSAGGSDGSDGVGSPAGNGQGTTTSEFGEGGTLYAGGGGGYGNTNWGYNSGGEGGAGGGGRAAYGGQWDGADGEDGEANTGGGGGAGYDWWNKDNTSETREKPGGNGGSGIIIIRNAR